MGTRTTITKPDTSSGLHPAPSGSGAKGASHKHHHHHKHHSPQYFHHHHHHHHFHHKHWPVQKWWYDPFLNPKYRFGSLFYFHFRPSSSLRFRIWLGSGYYSHWGWKPWPPRRWAWRPMSVCYTYFPRTVTYVSYVYTWYRPIVRHVPLVEYVTVPAEPEPCPYTYAEAWGFLADGLAEEALGAFACLSQDYPEDGLAHIGYAIANAMIGADDVAVAVMRHAMTIHPEALRYVPSDPALDEQLLGLFNHYSELSQRHERPEDMLFMMAVMLGSLGDYAGAHFTVGEAIHHGDSHASAPALRKMLAETLQAKLYGH